MRALVVSNMRPDAGTPGRGRFVRDQVAALARMSGLQVELYEFAPGARSYLPAAVSLRRRYAGRQLDIVHAHFGLTQWPALAVPARGRVVTLHGTDVRHPRTRVLSMPAVARADLIAVVSAPMTAQLPARLTRRPTAVLPCGVDLERFRPLGRRDARVALGLDPNEAFALFPADPQRAGKRYDLACQAAGPAPLRTLGAVAPERVPLWINAANAVLVPSDSEGFGLAVLEALACNVPVLATPVGMHAELLDGLIGALCAPWDHARWRAALASPMAEPDPRVYGRERAGRYSSERMALRVLDAWGAVLESKMGGARHAAEQANH